MTSPRSVSLVFIKAVNQLQSLGELLQFSLMHRRRGNIRTRTVGFWDNRLTRDEHKTARIKDKRNLRIKRSGNTGPRLYSVLGLNISYE